MAAAGATRIDSAQPRVLVRFAPGTTATVRARVIASVGAVSDRELPALGVTRIALPLAADDATGLAALRLARDPAVERVEPDATGTIGFTPNDPLFLTDPSFGVGQWGLRMTQTDRAWDVVRGSAQITVAVIDTGVDPGHPDLAGALLPGATFVSAPDPSCAPGATTDDNGHGTHVAGIIGASGNNGTGVAGVAFGVRILPVKALDCTGAGLLSDVASGVTWAADHGARIINISLGSNAAQQTLQDAIRYAVSRNVLVVAAAGNCGVTSSRCSALNEPQYPGAFPEVLAVAATDQSDAHASFSNIGGYVGIAAPGVRILSTTPTYPTTLSRSGAPTSYAAFSGTSQASPIVAGVAALLLSREPGLSVAQLTARLRATADDLGAPGADATFGAGRVNALRAVTTSATVRFGATYGTAAVPRSGTIVGPITVPVTLTNTSSFTWSAGGATPVRLAYHWRDLAGATVVWDGQRTALPADLPAGGTVTLSAAILPPRTPGSYVLRLDLVQEGVAWFSGNGVPTGDIGVTIASGLAASYAPAASAQSTFVLGPNSFSVSLTNTGTATWPSGGPAPVHLSYHWLSSGGAVVVWDGARAALPADLAPGQSAVVSLPVVSPSVTGSYLLRLDLVQEGVSWFSAQGVTPRDLAISVTTGFGATYAITSPATALLPGARVLVPVTLTNSGLLTWAAAGAAPVHVAAHVYDPAGALLVWDGERALLPADVAPGQSLTLGVPVAVPAALAPTAYDVRIDLVREGIAWLSGEGVATGALRVAADPDYRAAITLASRTISRGQPSVTVTVGNTSRATWTPGGSAPIDLSSHWLAADGTILAWDGPRLAVAAQPILPGGSVTLTLPLAVPPPGAAILVVDLVAEGLRWFGTGSQQPVTLVP
jgi:hypothetical protein